MTTLAIIAAVVAAFVAGSACQAAFDHWRRQRRARRIVESYFADVAAMRRAGAGKMHGTIRSMLDFPRQPKPPVS